MSVGKKSRSQVNRIRNEVYLRDKHECVVAGSAIGYLKPCVGELTIQHAFTRGMGSSARYDDIDCLRTMCAYHNGIIESDALFAKHARNHGWAAPRWVHDRGYSRVLPVWYSDGWYLLQDGQRIEISHEKAVECYLDIYGKEENDLGQSRR